VVRSADERASHHTIPVAMPEKKRTYGVRLIRGPFVSIPPHPESVSDVASLLLRTASETSSHPRAVDLFCGAGGMSLGLMDAGYDVVLGVDHDDAALETYAGQHRGLALKRDLSSKDDVDEIADLVSRLDVDLIAGGPPCQPFSKAGASKIRSLVAAGGRPAHDERRDLWQSFLDIVTFVHPAAVMLENVPDMAIGADTTILRSMVRRLEAEGYGVHTALLHAWEHGVPQHRQRFFLVALSAQLDFEWPRSRPYVVTVGDAIGDLPAVDGGWRSPAGADGYHDYEAPTVPHEFVKRARRGLRGSASKRLYDHITRPVRPDDREIFAAMSPSTRYSEIDISLRRYRDDIFEDKYKRLGSNELSRSITAHISRDGYWYIHPTQHRTLTIREAARLQTFPDRVRFAGPPSTAFRQIGNAVPPALAEVVGRAVRDSLRRAAPLGRSTSEVASVLATWFEAKDALAAPWLAAPSPWSSLQAQLMLHRLSARSIDEHWNTLEKLDTPERTHDARGALRAMAAQLGRPARADVVLEAASWYRKHPADLTDATAMHRAPGVSRQMARLAALVDAELGPTPVIVNEGSLRVASRVFGTDVTEKRRGSDGRLAVARLIGAENVLGYDESRAAMAAVLELAATVCGKNPSCSPCPLVSMCSAARKK
jgi:DNA (cytosine-5)-methyltransferase 1